MKRETLTYLQNVSCVHVHDNACKKNPKQTIPQKKETNPKETSSNKLKTPRDVMSLLHVYI